MKEAALSADPTKFTICNVSSLRKEGLPIKKKHKKKKTQERKAEIVLNGLPPRIKFIRKGS